MSVLFAILAITVAFALGAIFGLWLAGMLNAAPIIEDFDGHCAGCGATEAESL